MKRKSRKRQKAVTLQCVIDKRKAVNDQNPWWKEKAVTLQCVSDWRNDVNDFGVLKERVPSCCISS